MALDIKKKELTYFSWRFHYHTIRKLLITLWAVLKTETKKVFIYLLDAKFMWESDNTTALKTCIFVYIIGIQWV